MAPKRGPLLAVLQLVLLLVAVANAAASPARTRKSSTRQLQQSSKFAHCPPNYPCRALLRNPAQQQQRLATAVDGSQASCICIKQHMRVPTTALPHSLAPCRHLARRLHHARLLLPHWQPASYLC